MIGYQVEFFLHTKTDAKWCKKLKIAIWGKFTQPNFPFTILYSGNGGFGLKKTQVCTVVVCAINIDSLRHGIAVDYIAPPHGEVDCSSALQ